MEKHDGEVVRSAATQTDHVERRLVTEEHVAVEDVGKGGGQLATGACDEPAGHRRRRA